MSEKRVNGICLAYENLPFVQTTSARGVIAAHMSTERALPFTSHSFDLLHAHWVMAYLGTTPENLSRVLLEWDRVVRPGDSFHFPAGAVHQSIALTPCAYIEASTPHFNDRVHVEGAYGINEEAGGLPSTHISEIELR